MTGDSPVGWRTALGASVLLLAATPPAWFPGAEFLVVAGLAGLYAVATRARSPYRLAYLFGLAHVLGFSWSLRHVTGPGLVAIGLLGAVYSCWIVLWTRALGRRALAPLGFALGVAVTAWARAHAFDIAYPHGQPAHALYGWPALLGPVRCGGEVLTNALVALVAAGVAEMFGASARRRAGAVWLAGAVGVWVAVGFVPTTPGTGEAPAALRLAVVQSQYPDRFRRTAADFEALVAATAALARDPEPPRLVIWPESTWPVRAVGVEPTLERTLRPPTPPGAELLTSALWYGPDGRRAIAMLLGADGALRGFHEKRVPVPGGERAPFVDWLPDAVAGWLLDLLTPIVGYRPDQRAGRARSPLVTQDGVPFAALTCFDNAFAWLSRDAVDRGARLLAVVSNESWYLHGGELEQMVAMSVFAALETGTPVVRATVDGVTCVVEADGRVVARLPAAVGLAPAALVRTVPLGPGRLGPAGTVVPSLVAAAWGPGLLVLVGLVRAVVRRRREFGVDPSAARS